MNIIKYFKKHTAHSKYSNIQEMDKFEHEHRLEGNNLIMPDQCLHNKVKVGSMHQKSNKMINEFNPRQLAQKEMDNCKYQHRQEDRTKPYSMIMKGPTRSRAVKNCLDEIIEVVIKKSNENCKEDKSSLVDQVSRSSSTTSPLQQCMEKSSDNPIVKSPQTKELLQNYVFSSARAETVENENVSDKPYTMMLKSSDNSKISLWMKHYNNLINYKKKSGDCCVPPYYSQDTALAKFVQRQCARYKALLNGKLSSITLTQINLLNAIGFEWSAENDSSSQMNGEKQCRVTNANELTEDDEKMKKQAVDTLGKSTNHEQSNTYKEDEQEIMEIISDLHSELVKLKAIFGQCDLGSFCESKRDTYPWLTKEVLTSYFQKLNGGEKNTNEQQNSDFNELHKTENIKNIVVEKELDEAEKSNATFAPQENLHSNHTHKHRDEINEPSSFSIEAFPELLNDDFNECEVSSIENCSTLENETCNQHGKREHSTEDKTNFVHQVTTSPSPQCVDKSNTQEMSQNNIVSSDIAEAAKNTFVSRKAYTMIMKLDKAAKNEKKRKRQTLIAFDDSLGCELNENCNQHGTRQDLKEDKSNVAHQVAKDFSTTNFQLSMDKSGDNSLLKSPRTQKILQNNINSSVINSSDIAETAKNAFMSHKAYLMMMELAENNKKKN